MQSQNFPFPNGEEILSHMVLDRINSALTTGDTRMAVQIISNNLNENNINFTKEDLNSLVILAVKCDSTKLLNALTLQGADVNATGISFMYVYVCICICMYASTCKWRYQVYDINIYIQTNKQTNKQTKRTKSQKHTNIQAKHEY